MYMISVRFWRVVAIKYGSSPSVSPVPMSPHQKSRGPAALLGDYLSKRCVVLCMRPRISITHNTSALAENSISAYRKVSGEKAISTPLAILLLPCDQNPALMIQSIYGDQTTRSRIQYLTALSPKDYMPSLWNITRHGIDEQKKGYSYLMWTGAV